MARVTVQDCILKVENRFELVLLASHRARVLYNGEKSPLEANNDKPAVIALREIAEETTPISEFKENVIKSYQVYSDNEESETFEGSEIAVDTSETSKENNKILENNNPEEEITEKDQENIEVENSENTEDNILLAENEDIENINSGDQDK